MTGGGDTARDPALPDFIPGSVWLAGAGPGDPGLLTLLALHGLRHADIVVHDALIDDRVLALARPGAILEAWGKRGGREGSARQSDITARLIALAGEGRRVLRLKGGDPFVFGRGPEEARALTAAGIAVRIVPGITAGIGGLAYAGIAATAGDVNAAFALATGHGPDGTLPDDLDRVALAPVLVVYMGLSMLAPLRDRLLARGRPGDEPAALVVAAATESQRVIETTLAGLAEAAIGLAAPTLVVIGAATAPDRRLDWLEITGSDGDGR